MSCLFLSWIAVNRWRNCGRSSQDLRPQKTEESHLGKACYAIALCLVGIASGPVRGQDLSSPRSQSLPLPSVGVVREANAAPADKEADGKMTASDPQTAPVIESLSDKPDRRLSASWNNGFVAETADSDFRVHIGGRAEFDNSWFTQDDNLLLGPAPGTTFKDGSLFRRARLRADGLLWGWIGFVTEVNFANVQDASNVDNQLVQVGSVGLTDFYLTFRELPWIGNVRVGHFKAPVGLERYSSSNAWYYMERSSLYDAFFGPNNYQNGIMAFDSYADERLTWAAAFTRIGKSTLQSFGFDAADGAYAGALRLTGLPIYEDDGRTLMHLGVGFQHQALVSNQFSVASRPLVRAGSGGGTDTPNVVFSGNFFSPNGADIADLEWATVLGPFSLSAEYALAHCSDLFDTFNGATFSGPHGNVTYHAAYVEFGCFITPGDYRRYDKPTGTWGRTLPQREVVIDRHWSGWGAVQLLARYTYLDLVDGQPVLAPPATGGASAGIQQDLTLGANWYLNSQVWIMLNLVLSHINSVVPSASGNFQALGARVHIDF